MILKLFLWIVIGIIKFFVTLIMGLTPELSQEIATQGPTILRTFADYLDQSKNFLYFIIGEPFYFLVSFITAFITFKLVVYPIILLIRRNLTKTE